MNGIDLIRIERQRQQEKENWSIEHDVCRHMNGELAAAAQAYVAYAIRQVNGHEHPDSPPLYWPWERQWYKPADNPARNLEKAGALIAAEIDRLQKTEEIGAILERYQR